MNNEEQLKQDQELRTEVDRLKVQLNAMTDSAMNNGLALLKLEAAARAVVEARHYQGEDGWDRLKNAIAELEGLI